MMYYSSISSWHIFNILLKSTLNFNSNRLFLFEIMSKEKGERRMHDKQVLLLKRYEFYCK